jgi:hypothetical protein
MIVNIDRTRHATSRLLALICGERPGALGPRPISNDRRRAHPRGERSCLPAPSVADSVEALTCIFPALCAAVSHMLPGPTELLPGLTLDQASELFGPANTGRLASGLAAVEDHPRSGELDGVTDRATALLLALFDELAAATAVNGIGEPARVDMDRLIGLARAFRSEARAYIDFLCSLVAGEEPAYALERFLDQGVTEPGEQTGGLAA